MTEREPSVDPQGDHPDDENPEFDRFEDAMKKLLAAKPNTRPSGVITIEWEELGDEQEPFFRTRIHWEPGFGKADRPRMTSLFRQIAQMSEAEQDVAWPDDQTDEG